MAIIYSYPKKETLVDGDLVMITDSASTDPKNQTAQTSLKSISQYINAGLAGVSSLNGLAGSLSIITPQVGLNVATGPTTVSISANIYTGGTNVGFVPAGGDSNKFLKGDGTFSQITNSAGGVFLGIGTPTNTTANLALGSVANPLLNTIDSGDVGNAAKWIEVQIGTQKYYMALYAQN
jgi:hypothetical protein